VLADKRSELPYTAEDRVLLSAAGSAGGLALDRVLSAEHHASTPGSPGAGAAPARECVECGSVVDSDQVACACGGLLQRAPVPRVINEYLRLDRRIGAGGMGVVYVARDLRLQQTRAVKTLPGTDPATVARLRREARAMAAARHQNLATLFALEVWRGLPLLVMEYLDGGTLADRLRRGPVSPRIAFAWGAALAEGLGALHAAGLLHRDIKPSNIGFDAAGTAKLLDFGLAKLLPGAPTASMPAVEGQSTWSMTFSTDGRGVLGTPAYMSPECLSGSEPGPVDDLWGLSVSLLEACTGTNPFRAETPAGTVAKVITEWERAPECAAQLPAPARALFAVLLGPAAQRPRSASAMVEHLRQLAAMEG
jgi:eukaryotic-like serine/threonine-protein kinase